MMQHKKMRRLSARTICSYPSCNEEHFHKSKYTEHLSENITLISELLKKTLQICRSFFHGIKKKKAKTFYTLVNSAVLAVVYYVCQYDGHTKAHRRKEETDRKLNQRYHHGRTKRDTFCPARMNVKLHESDSTVSVTRIRAHNHPIGIKNTVHQPTPTSVLNSITTNLWVFQ